jgi:triacylglycerol lipase
VLSSRFCASRVLFRVHFPVNFRNLRCTTYGFSPAAPVQDWIDDLNFASTVPMGNCNGCEVHSGFYDSYVGLRDQMVAALNQIGGSSVMITGHSLGGAIACLAAYDLVSMPLYW